MKKSKFPLEHLSASSVNLLNNNEQEWIKKYIYGNSELNTVYTRFGRKMADFTDDDILIECILKRGNDKLKVIGYLDGYDKKTNTQYENKTATKLWTQKTADTLFQLKTYAMIAYKNNKKIPNQILTCRETILNDKELSLTGISKQFIVKQTLKDILETEAKYWRAYDKIIKITKKEYEKI